jgi:hypothetical protein
MEYLDNVNYMSEIPRTFICFFDCKPNTSIQSCICWNLKKNEFVLTIHF